MTDTVSNDPTYRKAARELERWLNKRRPAWVQPERAETAATPNKENEMSDTNVAPTADTDMSAAAALAAKYGAHFEWNGFTDFDDTDIGFWEATLWLGQSATKASDVSRIDIPFIDGAWRAEPYIAYGEGFTAEEFQLVGRQFAVAAALVLELNEVTA